MKSAEFVAVLELPGSENQVRCLELLLESFDLPYKIFADTKNLPNSSAVIAPLSLLPSFSRHHSAFFYTSGDPSPLRAIASNARLQPIPKGYVKAKVCSSDSSFTGPFQDLEVTFNPSSNDCCLSGHLGETVTPIIRTEQGTPFFQVAGFGAPTFVLCSSELVNLERELPQPWFDVREQFLASVPLVMYLKWALREPSWRASESGACFIVDDPLLQNRYGFCDFPRLEKQMREYSFATSIAMIPWNAKRTSKSMSKLMQKSKGRLSACIHGCDHTRGEFGTRDEVELNDRTSRALEQMNDHRAQTGIVHDPVMVFPQGIFSSESLKVLQQNQFIAAVNTDGSPATDDGMHEPLNVHECWRPTISRHSSFPLFLRRYPSQGLENFAFDLLLGKPCLVVEHHQFFRNEHRQVIAFVKALNSLKASLHWRRLGEVIRRFYHFRYSERGMELKMFGNELLLTNSSDDDCHYFIQKADADSSGITTVKLDGKPLEWKTDDSQLTFEVTLPPGREALIQVEYAVSQQAKAARYSFGARTKIAARRYLSEFRDNFLSRHEPLLQLAQSTMALVRK